MKDRAFVLRIVVVYSPVECERRTRMAKRYEELTISDDFMFGKAMGDKVASRSGWDMYTRDKKRMYDAEMQNLNHQPVEKI